MDVMHSAEPCALLRLQRTCLCGLDGQVFDFCLAMFVLAKGELISQPPFCCGPSNLCIDFGTMQGPWDIILPTAPARRPTGSFPGLHTAWDAACQTQGRTEVVARLSRLSTSKVR